MAARPFSASATSGFRRNAAAADAAPAQGGSSLTKPFDVVSFIQAAGNDRVTAAYLVLTVVAAIVAIYYAQDYCRVVSDARWPSWARNGIVAALAFCAAAVCLAGATAAVGATSNETTRWTLLGIFVAVLALAVLAVYFFFCRRDSTTAFYLIVGAIGLAVVHCVVIWSAGEKYMIAGVAPAAALLCAVGWFLYRSCPSRLRHGKFPSVDDFCEPPRHGKFPTVDDFCYQQQEEEQAPVPRPSHSHHGRPPRPVHH